VLVFAVLLLLGLFASLTIRRRRFWARITSDAAGDRTVVEIGGLARTDRAGYGEEFDRLRADLTPATVEATARHEKDG
jgi:cytochrome c biogenesis protein